MTENKAFPVSAASVAGDIIIHQSGMSLLDYFAGQALTSLDLQAYISKPAAVHLAKSA